MPDLLGAAPALIGAKTIHIVGFGCLTIHVVGFVFLVAEEAGLEYLIVFAQERILYFKNGLFLKEFSFLCLGSKRRFTKCKFFFIRR